MDDRTAPLMVPPDLLDRLAVAEHLCPVFQAIFDQNLRVMAYEALMRVVGADGQMMPLGRYIAQLESCGLISLADIRMLEQVKDVLQHVQLQTVTVNASLRTLDTRMSAYLEAAEPLLSRCKSVIVEITETAPVVEAGHLRSAIRTLREGGFLVALDDAKMGHAYGHPDLLLATQPDVVKIDGLFFHETLSCRLKERHLRDIVSATHSYGGKVVIEWVDSGDKLDAAFNFGADWVQGFHFGQPRSVWPSHLCREANRNFCGHAHCPIRDHGAAHPPVQVIAPGQRPPTCGSRPSMGAVKIDSSIDDRYSV